MSESNQTEIVLNLRYENILPRFLELRRAELNAIGNAVEQKDFAALTRFGHNLHGTGAGYGLEHLSLLGAKMESRAIAEDIDALHSVYEELADFLRDLKICYRNTVLFVDDQTEVLTLLRRLFAADEYICIFASSGSEALEILNHTPVDVMVCDLVMPDMGGLELLSIVRQRFPQVVRLVLSGQSQVPSILAAINAGHVFRYLTKPWRVDNDARAIIAEAVAYSNEINRQQSRLYITFDVLKELLELSGKPYLVLGRDNRVEAISQEFQQKWQQGQHIKDQELEGTNGEVIALDSSHSVWVWESSE